MHPTLWVLGKPVRAYVLFNYYLGAVIPFILIAVLGRKYGLKKGVPFSFGFYVFVVLASGLIGFLVGESAWMIIAGRWDWGRLFHPQVGEGSIYFAHAVGAVLTSALLLKAFKRPVLFWLDLTAVYMAFGLGVRKIGCFLTGCCRGTPTSLPWGVVFPGTAVPVHPLQLYESLFGFVMGIFLWRKLMSCRWKDGEGFALFFALFSFMRLITYPIRDIPEGAQFVALGPVIFFVLVLIFGGLYLLLKTQERGAVNESDPAKTVD